MPYRYDPDLQFLQYCSDRDLDDLVRILIYNKDGSLRLTEDLTYKDIYKKHQPNHSMYWQEIAITVCTGKKSLVKFNVSGQIR